MIEMMKYWVRDIGIDGYRCDVAELVPTDFWERARTELDKIKPIMMLSEGTLPEHHVTAFDLTYSWNVYDVLPKVIDGTTSVRVFSDMYTTEGYQFPKGALRLRFNTNHDKNAWDAPAVEKYSPKGAKTTAVLAFTYPGVPLLYNGEEAGNAERLSLFEKVDIDWTRNIEFRAFYHALTALRASHASLRRGEFIPVENSSDGKVLSFLRRAGDDEVLIVLNLSRKDQSCVVEIPHFEPGSLEEYFTKEPFKVANDRLEVNLKPLDYCAFLPSKKNR
jgi:glycosidase